MLHHEILCRNCTASKERLVLGKHAVGDADGNGTNRSAVKPTRIAVKYRSGHIHRTTEDGSRAARPPAAVYRFAIGVLCECAPAHVEHPIGINRRTAVQTRAVVREGARSDRGNAVDEGRTTTKPRGVVVGKRGSGVRAANVRASRWCAWPQFSDGAARQRGAVRGEHGIGRPYVAEGGDCATLATVGTPEFTATVSIYDPARRVGGEHRRVVGET